MVVAGGIGISQHHEQTLQTLTDEVAIIEPPSKLNPLDITKPTNVTTDDTPLLIVGAIAIGAIAIVIKKKR